MPAHLFTLPSGPTLPAVTGLPEGYPFHNTTDGQIYVLTAGVFVKKGSGTAAGTAFTPVGALASTDVQAALAELDTEKSATTHVHAAAAVTYAGSTNLAATNVEAALDELDAEKAAAGHTHTDTVFDSEVRQPGTLVVGQVAIPGTRVPRATTLREVYLAVGTAPVGAALTVEVRNGATVLATVSIADGTTTGSVTGLTAAIAAGTRVTYHVTAVGATTAGADLAVALVCS